VPAQPQRLFIPHSKMKSPISENRNGADPASKRMDSSRFS
jgi:hypothetical protein